MFAIRFSGSRQQHIDGGFWPVVVIALQIDVPITDSHVSVRRYDIDLAALESGLPMFAYDEDRQRAATLENCSELAGTLRIEMLRNDDWRGKRFVKCAYERRQRAHAACGSANDYEIPFTEF